MKKKLFFALVLVGCIWALAQDSGTEARSLYDRSLEAIGRATTRNELKAAASLLEQAKEAAPGWAESRFALGRTYKALDIYDRAAESYEEYLELSPDALDREEAQKHVRICRQQQEWLDEDKQLMASGTWANVRHLPPVRFNQPQVSYRFRMDAKGRLHAQNPWLGTYDFNEKANSWIKEKWLPVTFDGKFFEYQYTIYYKALDPARTEYMIETVRGEIIHGEPLKVRQEAWHRGSPTTYPYQADLETLRGEVLHAVR
jgi:tetratricopeptide (TPR) repeat protein